MAAFYVFIGGGLGCVFRHYIGSALNKEEWSMPYGTLAANLIACFILGAILSYHQKFDLGINNRLLLATGFCGGFSTFSTFSQELLKKIMHGHIGYALAYSSISIVFGLFSVYVGLSLFK